MSGCIAHSLFFVVVLEIMILVCCGEVERWKGGKRKVESRLEGVVRYVETGRESLLKCAKRLALVHFKKLAFPQNSKFRIYCVLGI